MEKFSIVDGKAVWDLHATHGFPLEMSIPMLIDRGLIPTWVDLLRGAKADGANLHRVVLRIQEALGDSSLTAYQVAYIIKGLYLLLSNREAEL